MALTALVRFALIELEKQMLVKARLAMSLSTGVGFMAKLLRLPIAFFDQRFAGEVAGRVRLNETLVDLLTGKLAGARVAGLKDMETFKASGAEDMLFARWTGLAITAQNSRQRANRITAIITVTILIWGGFAVMAGTMTLGGLVGYQTLAASFVAPVTALAGFGAEFQQIRANTARLDDVLGQADDPRFARADPGFDSALPGGSLQLEDVSFG